MSANIHNDVVNQYFSGQGVVLLGTKNALTGLPNALLPLGNVSDLKIMVATSSIDHKGAQDGQRAIDKRMNTEVKVTLSITLQNWIASNLAIALRGGAIPVPAGSVTAESLNGWAGGVTALSKVSITLGTLVLTRTADSQVLQEYIDSTHAWDYKQNTDAGSFKFNDGSAQMNKALGATQLVITAVTGSGTAPTITATHSLQVGDLVTFSPTALSGANAAAINGLTLQVASITTTVSFTLQQIGGGNVVGTTITLSDGICYAQQKTSPNVTAATAVAVSTGAGLPTTITVANTCAVGDWLGLAGFAGAGGIALNGLQGLNRAQVLPGSTTAVLLVDIDTSGKTITLGNGSVFVASGVGVSAVPLTAAYSYAAQEYMDALTQPMTEMYMRFEGLNTAAATVTGGFTNFAPVVVDVFKFSIDPLKELAMIGDVFGEFILEGGVLADPTIVTGSKFFHVKKLTPG